MLHQIIKLAYQLLLNVSQPFKKSILKECIHVDHIGLKTAPKDAEIWNYALIYILLLLTNDGDFLSLPI